MHKFSTFVFVLVIASLISGCLGSGEVIADPQDAAGYPVDPAAQAEAAQTVTVTEANVWDTENLKALTPVRELILAEAGIILRALQEPEGTEDALFLFAAAPVTAISDGPQIGVNDMVAVIMASGAAFYLAAHAEESAKFAIAQIEAIEYQSWWTAEQSQTATTISAYTAWTNTLALNIEENIFLSENHEESARVVQLAYDYAAFNDNGWLKRKGDGSSNGSVRIYAGIQPNMKANVAILLIVNTHVDFIVLQCDLLNAGYSAIPGGGTSLGGGSYIVTNTGKIVAAWTLTKDIGHEYKDPSQFLTIGQGWDYWAVMQAKYNLYTELAEIRLP